MNVLFISISPQPHLSGHSISIDLMHELCRQGHQVYVVGALERRENAQTYVAQEAGCTILRVKIGNNKRASIIEKGITTVLLPKLYIRAIKKHFPDVKFDLVLYPTPPVTHAGTVEYIKRRDGAKSYLLLKDIFPQNAVDIGMMRKTGMKGLLYRYFRHQEKKLYAMSDRIGCMSQANVDYVLKHNPEVSPEKIEVCPNTVEVYDMSICTQERAQLREKYGIPQDKKVFIYGGNLGKPQGIPFVIACLEQQRMNPDAYFLIVGEGTEYKKLETWFAEVQPENMKLLKRLPKDDYDRMVAACDVGLIFLDHRFTIPNFPSRLLSYMQAGLPVLACTDPNTDVGKEIVDGGFGWWCESDDPQNFDRAIKQALASDLHTMGKAGYGYLEANFSVQRSYQTIMKGLAD